VFYRVRNFFLEKKIIKLNAAANRFLLRDLSEQYDFLERIRRNDPNDVALDILDRDLIQDYINTIEKRLKVVNKYSILIDTFRADPTRRYMVNHNFHKFLKAIQYLYINLGVTISNEVSLAPAGVYYAINKVEEVFAVLTNTSLVK
jgi:hypothetical protein